ncbi:P-loop containing nucleoside triphosphate hydrolase protein [Lasiosphaeria hispida]|uniref:P-loop containing nucleoside triphosphate hydrolase protein n=1 Tax=Lasiosphaeria hispida TaxID=260671 RepID=A0AAJ0H9I3_9PEZI|nr:P-loop containing nucleoside triphosphate hydrolase protein [Lasiosphaeria hispida]
MAGGRPFPASAHRSARRGPGIPQFCIERNGSLYRPDASISGNGGPLAPAQDRPQLTKLALDKHMAILYREDEAAGKPTSQARRREMIIPHTMYGQLYMGQGKGRLEYEPSPRLFAWLSEARWAKPPEDEEAQRAHEAAVTNEVAENNKAMEEAEESEDSESEREFLLANEDVANEEPSGDTGVFSTPNLGSRIGNTVRQTLSRLSTRKRSGSRNETKCDAEGVLASSRDVFSRLSVTPGVGCPAVAAPARRLKFCLLGPAGSGKTTFIGRILTREFILPLLTTAVRTVPVSLTTEDKRRVDIEMWDFPGTISQELTQQMMGNFFHAAIICYAIDDEASAAAVNEAWKPVLDRALIECPLFVLGLKKDLRVEAPTLDLPFSPARKQATEELGRAIAHEARANGFAEVSAASGEGVAETWQAIVNGVVAMTRDGERARARLIRREKAKDAVAGVGAAVVGVFARKKGAEDASMHMVEESGVSAGKFPNYSAAARTEPPSESDVKKMKQAIESGPPQEDSRVPRMYEAGWRAFQQTALRAW